MSVVAFVVELGERSARSWWNLSVWVAEPPSGGASPASTGAAVDDALRSTEPLDMLQLHHHALSTRSVVTAAINSWHATETTGVARSEIKQGDDAQALEARQNFPRPMHAVRDVRLQLPGRAALAYLTALPCVNICGTAQACMA